MNAQNEYYKEKVKQQQKIKSKQDNSEMVKYIIIGIIIITAFFAALAAISPGIAALAYIRGGEPSEATVPQNWLRASAISAIYAALLFVFLRKIRATIIYYAASCVLISIASAYVNIRGNLNSSLLDYATTEFSPLRPTLKNATTIEPNMENNSNHAELEKEESKQENTPPQIEEKQQEKLVMQETKPLAIEHENEEIIEQNQAEKFTKITPSEVITENQDTSERKDINTSQKLAEINNNEITNGNQDKVVSPQLKACLNDYIKYITSGEPKSILGILFKSDGTPTISRAIPDSPAAYAGLRTHDEIIAYNGIAIRDKCSLQMLVLKSEPGIAKQLVIKRGELIIPLVVTPIRKQ